MGKQAYDALASQILDRAVDEIIGGIDARGETTDSVVTLGETLYVQGAGAVFGFDRSTRPVTFDNLIYQSTHVNPRDQLDLWSVIGVPMGMSLGRCIRRILRARAASRLAYDSDMVPKVARICRTYPAGYLQEVQMCVTNGARPPYPDTIVKIGNVFYGVIEGRNSLGDHFVYLDRPLDKEVRVGEEVQAGLEYAQVHVKPGGLSCVSAKRATEEACERLCVRGLHADWQQQANDVFTMSIIFGVVADPSMCRLERTPSNGQAFFKG